MKEINDERIDTLFKAVLELKTVDECRRFFTDLCTISELKSMSQRMEVALMLKDKNIYTDIATKTTAASYRVPSVPVESNLHFITSPQQKSPLKA